MLRLVIADDEKIIRETISSLIDWNRLGIEVVGICKDGVEAYNTILDEYPDIVLTDIKMPGMTGLDLISKISAVDRQIEFVILSGFGEFSYATEAMRHGVKHYLLKPCNEADIEKVMEEVAEDCYRKKRQSLINEQHAQMTRQMHTALVQNILLEAISASQPIEDLIASNSLYLNFETSGYDIHYFYFLEEPLVESFLAKLQEFCADHPDIAPDAQSMHAVYVRNTLIVFYESYGMPSRRFSSFIYNLCDEDPRFAKVEHQVVTEPNLASALSTIVSKIRRYETIYLINGTTKIATTNLDSLLHQSSEYISRLNTASGGDRTPLNDLVEMLSGIDNPAYLKVILADLLLNSEYGANKNPIAITEFLLEISDLTDSAEIMKVFIPNQGRLFPSLDPSAHRQKDFIEKTLQYIDQHLSDSNLSLKWIAENYLFMNVDYVSKQFMKQTGVKFSSYLSALRIDRAKKRLLENRSESIYTVAEEVGFGNNPQYFSQIFKKSTGMTPTAYVKAMKGE